jgi:hypothetical protein
VREGEKSWPNSVTKPSRVCPAPAAKGAHQKIVAGSSELPSRNGETKQHKRKANERGEKTTQRLSGGCTGFAMHPLTPNPWGGIHSSFVRDRSSISQSHKTTIKTISMTPSANGLAQSTQSPCRWRTAWHSGPPSRSLSITRRPIASVKLQEFEAHRRPTPSIT